MIAQTAKDNLFDTLKRKKTSYYYYFSPPSSFFFAKACFDPNERSSQMLNFVQTQRPFAKSLPLAIRSHLM